MCSSDLHFHFVAAPALHLNRSIHVFEREASPRGQWIDVMKILIRGVRRKYQTGKRREQHQPAQRGSHNARSLVP